MTASPMANLGEGRRRSRDDGGRAVRDGRRGLRARRGPRARWLTAAIPIENPYCSCKLTVFGLGWLTDFEQFSAWMQVRPRRDTAFP